MVKDEGKDLIKPDQISFLVRLLDEVSEEESFSNQVHFRVSIQSRIIRALGNACVSNSSNRMTLAKTGFYKSIASAVFQKGLKLSTRILNKKILFTRIRNQTFEIQVSFSISPKTEDAELFEVACRTIRTSSQDLQSRKQASKICGNLGYLTMFENFNFALVIWDLINKSVINENI